MSLYKNPSPIEMIRGYSRNGTFPIDKTSLYFSYEDAEAYVRESNTVYPGMIISVDDKLKKRTAVYRVEYNRGNNLQQKYILEEIGLGSSGGNLFNFLGTLETLENLYNIQYPQAGDMYIVKKDNDGNDTFNAYVCTDPENEILEERWENINIQVGYASQYADGIITKELYSSFVSTVNDEKHDSLYFSKFNNTNNPENNNWIKVEHNEGETDYKILSSGKTRDLINSIIEGQPPVVTVTTETSLSLAEGTEIEPAFIIEFKKNSAGNLIRLKIEKIIDQTFSTVIYNDVPNYTVNENIYKINYKADKEIIKLGFASLKYRFTVYYAENDLTGYPGGDEFASIEFNGLQSVEYGTNGTKTLSKLCSEGDSVTLRIVPMEKDKITTVFFKVPVLLKVNAISYDTQNDYFFIDKFIKTSDGLTNNYEFTVPSGCYINYNCQFTLYL